jgi:hypothetical protein
MRFAKAWPLAALADDPITLQRGEVRPNCVVGQAQGLGQLGHRARLPPKKQNDFSARALKKTTCPPGNIHRKIITQILSKRNKYKNYLTYYSSRWKFRIMKATFNNPNAVVSAAGEIDTDWSSPGYQAFRILQLGFVAAPILAGLDKFFHLLVNWDQYVPALIAQLSPIGVHQLMLVVGVIEIVAGLGVALKPRIFAYVVAAWLLVIIANLLLIPGYFDVALRDFGLFLGALALARLSQQFARG